MTPLIKEIQLAVLRRYPYLSLNDLVSHRRTHDVVLPRQIAMYLAKELTPKSYPEIARHFDDRDHSSAIYAFRKIKHLIEIDLAIKGIVDDVRSDFEFQNGCPINAFIRPEIIAR